MQTKKYKALERHRKELKVISTAGEQLRQHGINKKRSLAQQFTKTSIAHIT